jgi:hypothetical protein
MSSSPPHKKTSSRRAGSVRSAQRAKLRPLPPADHPLPASAFPTIGEMEDLGRFADRVAAGKERLTRIKL